MPHTVKHVRKVALPSGELIPALGQGTWHMGEATHRRGDEIAALRLGLDLGLSVIDTAEMYGDGAAEQLVAEALGGRRNEAFLVSKVLPQNATWRGTITACERSLGRLRTDRIDLYLLHWRSSIPLEETLEAFIDLVATGKIRYWGVSNFDVPDMEALTDLPGGATVATDQVLYNLAHRGIEWELLPWCRERNIPVMAYSPIGHGRMLQDSALAQVAARSGVTPAQVALAWLLRRNGIVAIPKASTPRHVRENRAAMDLRLSQQDLAVLDDAFPPPTALQPLETI